MKIELIAAPEAEKSVVRQMLELYAYDFSAYDAADIDEHGFYGYPYLDHYWTEATRQPCIIKVDGQLAGLVLVSDDHYAEKDPHAKSISEFFIMRKYRRQGIGKTVAFQVFNQY